MSRRHYRVLDCPRCDGGGVRFIDRVLLASTSADYSPPPRCQLCKGGGRLRYSVEDGVISPLPKIAPPELQAWADQIDEDDKVALYRQQKRKNEE